MLKQNVGTLDRLIRFVLALVLGYLVIVGKVTGLLAVILTVVAMISLVTGALGWCGLYAVCKISTK